MTSSLINNTVDVMVQNHRVPALNEGEVSLRRFPYPYKAAMTICSDIDETETLDEFLEIQRLLNTKNMTSMGEGVGLEIGNSFYFYDDEDKFSYFIHDESARRVIIDLIHAGYIDCLHSYGDAAARRDQVLRALDVLYKADCKLDVWVNHYGARSNFSRKFEYFFGECRGDDARSDVYHADITLDYGIRFVWVGAMTRLVGQSLTNSWPPLATAFDPHYPMRSSVNIVREIGKYIVGTWGDERYTLYKSNQLTKAMQLADGQKVYEFIRYCNHPISVSQGATSRGLAYTISRRVLEHLKAVQGFMIVYAHFGKNSDCQHVIAPETQAALRNLEHDYRTGEIYVTTTSKLLNYYHVCKYLAWSHQQVEGQIQIRIDYLDDPVFGKVYPTTRQLQGLTFHVPDSSKADIYVQGVIVQDIQRNPTDNFGIESVMIPCTHLSFPY